MNTIREINKINERELQLGVKGSWHDEYKDSAYVFVGGLAFELTEGDVLTIFSQFGEIIDINLPRDKETGKTKGFGFLMYEDQRSTVLAVDNMNGALVLGRTIRVDHTRNYRQPGKRNDEGEYEEPEGPTYNAMPPTIEDSDSDESSEEEPDDLDDEDPMAAFIRAEKKAQKKLTQGEKGKGKKRKHDGGEGGEKESKEEKRLRKEEKRAKKEEKRVKKEGKEKEKGKGKGKETERIKEELDGEEAYRSRSRSHRVDEEDKAFGGKRRRADREDWRDGKFELEREERERQRTERNGAQDGRESYKEKVGRDDRYPANASASTAGAPSTSQSRRYDDDRFRHDAQPQNRDERRVEPIRHDDERRESRRDYDRDVRRDGARDIERRYGGDSEREKERHNGDRIREYDRDRRPGSESRGYDRDRRLGSDSRAYDRHSTTDSGRDRDHRRDWDSRPDDQGRVRR